jgi:hypothetical protein
MSNNGIKAVEGTITRILDAGEVVELAYDGAMGRHMGSLWWGTASGYRAMQAAAQALSKDGLWSRDNLYVVTAHPGGGVADAVDYVTKARSRDRYNCVRRPGCGKMGCDSTMRYEWWVSDGKQTAVVKLRSDYVPWAFYELAERLETPNELETDMKSFEIFKVNLSARLWNDRLEDSFGVVELLDRPLEVGATPDEVNMANYWDTSLLQQNV